MDSLLESKGEGQYNEAEKTNKEMLIKGDHLAYLKSLMPNSPEDVAQELPLVWELYTIYFPTELSKVAKENYPTEEVKDKTDEQIISHFKPLNYWPKDRVDLNKVSANLKIIEKTVETLQNNAKDLKENKQSSQPEQKP